jgi:hypothetical protein
VCPGGKNRLAQLSQFACWFEFFLLRFLPIARQVIDSQCLAFTTKEPPMSSTDQGDPPSCENAESAGKSLVPRAASRRLTYSALGGMTAPPSFAALDLIELDGKDLRRIPIEHRKANIVVNQHYDGDGAIIFEQACALRGHRVKAARIALPPAGSSAGARSRTRQRQR